MVRAVRRGGSMRQVARDFGVSLATVQLWVQRARNQRLDRVDWLDRPEGCPRSPHRTPAEMEDLILTVRKELKEHSALGEFGGLAIRRELVARGVGHPPSIRTIGRILERRGALDGHYRVRRPAPPRGWYLPDLAAGRVELDSFDIVEGLFTEGGHEVEVLNAVSLVGGLPGSWPRSRITAKNTVESIIEHWRQYGLPGYAQFDNDTIFQGPHQYRDTVGRVTRLCLSLRVIPVFIPPRETGFQAAVENYNGQWQAKVFHRFPHDSLGDVQRRSTEYVNARRWRSAARIETAARREFPPAWRLNLQTSLTGRIIYLRRTTEQGATHLLGRAFPVDPHWPHRLVRAEVDLDRHVIEFYALRRRKPDYQPLLAEMSHRLIKRRFKG